MLALAFQQDAHTGLDAHTGRDAVGRVAALRPPPGAGQGDWAGVAGSGGAEDGRVHGQIAAWIAESDALDHLAAPVSRLSGLDAPIPYSPELEKLPVPQLPRHRAGGRELMEAG